MNIDQQLNYLNKDYKIISTEQEFIIHPAAIGLMPISHSSLQCLYSSSFHIEDYRLFLDKLVIQGTDNTNLAGTNEKQYEFNGCAVSYNGAILLGSRMVREYTMKSEKTASFSYQNVLELVFEDGVLITTVDHSKKMLRIRKNIELGLRDLSVNRDVRCIRRFLNSSFIGDYKPFYLTANRLKYLKDMRKDYQNSNFIKQINSIE